MPNAKDVAELGAAILGVTPLAPFAPIAGIVAKFLPGDDDATKKQKLAMWKVQRIPEWKIICRKLMDAPYPKATKGEMLKSAIRGDWFEAFGDPPKERWVEQLHGNVYDATLIDMQLAALGV